MTAISLRKRLENEAKRLEDMGGKYIRPIVLFQAEANMNENSTTYEKIKRELVEMGIPEEEIAIKTADKDDIKNQDLMSRACPIRYIVTVNALKEGWDCPFAYILATIANRSSVVDVEQIIGRILRLPNTKKSESAVLNLSYVITSLADFFATCNKVVDGLKVLALRLLQFALPDAPSLFSTEAYCLLQKEDLYVGFALLDKDTKIDFSMLDVEMARVDIEEGHSTEEGHSGEEGRNVSPKAWQLQGFDSAYMKEWFDA